MIFRRKAKKFTDIRISLRILLTYLSVCSSLTVVSGVVYYGYARRVVIESVGEQASLLCGHHTQKFSADYSKPIERELRLLVEAPQLNSYLMSPSDELPIYRADVERLFLSVSKLSQTCISTTFLGASGREEVSICGGKRIRTNRSLDQIGQDGVLGRETKKLFAELESDRTKMLSRTRPFYDSQHRLSVLVGMRKQEPEAGGFGGVVVQHYDLGDFVESVSQAKVLNTSVVWVYGERWQEFSSPPESEIRQDPRAYLAGDKSRAASGVCSGQCILPGSDQPVLTVACSVPSQVIARQLLPVTLRVAAVCSVFLVLSLLSSILVSRWISRPVRQLTEAVKRMCPEDLDLRLSPAMIESGDEIGVLARAFERITTELKGSTTSMDNLLREVAERERVEEMLRKNVQDLARFNKAAVGRERRMIGLKQEINALLLELGQEEKYRVASAAAQECRDEEAAMMPRGPKG